MPTINLRWLIENWLKDQDAHHFIHATPLWITCNCPKPDLFFLVIQEAVFVAKSKKCDPVVELRPANPNFFDKLQFFLEQACEKRQL